MMKKIFFSLSMLFIGYALFAQTISGKYILVKESDGQIPKSGATISIHFNSKNAGYGGH
jgi:hypothetical protein